MNEAMEIINGLNPIAFVPFLAGVIGALLVIKGRHVLTKSLGLVVLAVGVAVVL